MIMIIMSHDDGHDYNHDNDNDNDHDHDYDYDYDYYLFIFNLIPQSFYRNYPKKSLSWEFSISTWNMVSYDLLLFMLKIETETPETDSMSFLVFRRDHLRSTTGSFAVYIGIICGSIWGSFPFWRSFAAGDHLRRCIIYHALSLQLSLNSVNQL